jgi:hypothetical protein
VAVEILKTMPKPNSTDNYELRDSFIKAVKAGMLEVVGELADRGYKVGAWKVPDQLVDTACLPDSCCLLIMAAGCPMISG